jgi:hypothetical protein
MDILLEFAQLIPPQTLMPRVVDASGTPISGLIVDYVSLNPDVATVERGSDQVLPIAAGHVSIVARTIAFGVPKADTMTYVVQPPFGSYVYSSDQTGFAYGPADVRTTPVITTIVAGGVVAWQHLSATMLDIIFDDPTHVAEPPVALCDLLPQAFPPGPYCGTGNVAPFLGAGPGQFLNTEGYAPWAFRRFPLAGTYPYHSTTNGAHGVVIVLEPTAPSE